MPDKMNVWQWCVFSEITWSYLDGVMELNGTQWTLLSHWSYVSFTNYIINFIFTCISGLEVIGLVLRGLLHLEGTFSFAPSLCRISIQLSWVGGWRKTNYRDECAIDEGKQISVKSLIFIRLPNPKNYMSLIPSCSCLFPIQPRMKM